MMELLFTLHSVGLGLVTSDATGEFYDEEQMPYTRELVVLHLILGPLHLKWYVAFGERKYLDEK